ncbi:hypothetical protein ABZ807_20290 [Micromonospora sp. NPDC047548]|uniref:hypothetical protein n=1 Tax=Micromonospora sp. NPDC047548 TaxID=3155624 RepID=UPI0033F6B7E2
MTKGGRMSSIDELVQRSVTLKRELLDYARKPRFDRAFRQEIRARFGRVVVVEDEGELSNFFDWFIQQHRLHDGRTVVDLFVEAHPELPDTEREFLLGWRDVREGVFEVTGRDGPVLHTVNVVDDLPYRIRTNTDGPIFDRMPPGSYIGSRIVPVHSDWLLSGTTALYSAQGQAGAYSTAVRLAAEQPALVFHNPQRVAHAWDLQRAQHAAFVAHFGSDEVTLGVDELDKAMRGYWDTYSGEPGTAPPTDLDWLDDAVETIGVIYDQQTGLGMYADYDLAQQAFADPDLMRRPRHKEIVKAYLHDDTVDPVPLQRLSARHPDNADRVLRAATGKPAFTWHEHGEQLLRKYKADWYASSHLPRLTVLSDRLAAHIRAGLRE